MHENCCLSLQWHKRSSHSRILVVQKIRVIRNEVNSITRMCTDWNSTAHWTMLSTDKCKALCSHVDSRSLVRSLAARIFRLSFLLSHWPFVCRCVTIIYEMQIGNRFIKQEEVLILVLRLITIQRRWRVEGWNERAPAHTHNVRLESFAVSSYVNPFELHIHKLAHISMMNMYGFLAAFLSG